MARGAFLLTYAVIFVSALFVSRDGQAESSSAKEREARTACLAGDYSLGVRLLSELFVSSKDPGFIYNQARCFEQNSRYEEAIGRFREYLRAGKHLGDEERADAEKHIADCKGLLASEKPRAAEAPLAPASQPETENASAAEKPSTTVHQTNPAAGSSGLRTGGIATASAGGAVLVAGIVFNLQSNSLAQDLKKTDGYTSDKESNRKTYATLAWLGYGVGAACVATGAILYLLGPRSDGEGNVALLPSFAPGQAGAVVKGAF
jgi:hypothetical protein